MEYTFILKYQLAEQDSDLDVLVERLKDPARKIVTAIAMSGGIIFTAIVACLNNIGPGLNQVGPMMNFGAYSNFAKLVLIFDMLAGRLEIFPMLVLFMPDTWRRF